jgi:hypothetical protein
MQKLYLGLTAILKYQLKKVSYIISRYFQSILSYLNRLKTAKSILINNFYIKWWRRDIELPPYCQRCLLIALDVFSSRHRVLCALFISDVWSSKFGCPIILSSLRLNVYFFNTRLRMLLKEDPHRMNEPLNGSLRIFNEFSDLFEFGGSKDGFRVRIKERMRQSSCVCCTRS